MALTPNIRATSGEVLAVESGAGGSIRATEGVALGVYNIPTPYLRSTEANVSVVYRWTAQTIDVTQGYVMAVVRGTVANPSLRSWYYTLDGHDFWVLKLGTSFKTFVFDIQTGQWAQWATEGSTGWRASVGMNWRSSDDIAATYGSNVIVGDDSFGVLWVLDPEYSYDDSPYSGSDPTTFTRIATGQVPTRERNYVPIYSVDLAASFGNPGVTANTVTLSYSDDQGTTYVNADAPIVSLAGDYNQEFTWRSLGRFRAPGRLFRITDDGAFARIDNMDVTIE